VTQPLKIADMRCAVSLLRLSYLQNVDTGFHQPTDSAV